LYCIVLLQMKWRGLSVCVCVGHDRDILVVTIMLTEKLW